MKVIVLAERRRYDFSGLQTTACLAISTEFLLQPGFLQPLRRLPWSQTFPSLVNFATVALMVRKLGPSHMMSCAHQNDHNKHVVLLLDFLPGAKFQ